MRQSVRRLDVSTVADAETQIYTSLLLNSKVVHNNTLRSENDVAVIDNNSNELIGLRQQGGVLLSVRNDLEKYSSLVGKDETGLGL